jgi:uncharacterized protein (TIGR02391 family)
LRDGNLGLSSGKSGKACSHLDIIAQNGHVKRRLIFTICPMQSVAYAPFQKADGSDPLTDLHPRVREIASKYFETGHFRATILDTYIALDNEVQNKSGLDKTGMALMDHAFTPNKPLLKISDSLDERQGFLFLFKGAMGAIRNPKAHRVGKQIDPQRTLEWLSFASVLFRIVDESRINSNIDAQTKDQHGDAGL